MGACYSSCVVVHCGLSPQSLVSVEAGLSTGDLVLLQDKIAPASPTYVSRAQSWTSFTHVGFLVRDGFGPAGLAVCHADYRTSAGSQVVKENLQDMINSGQYHVMLARPLCQRLSPEQCDLVSNFVDLNMGKLAPASAPHATLLMACGALSTSCERLHCSEFVATMLQLVGLVQPSPDNPLEFSATHPKGYVVEPPLTLQQPPSPQLSPKWSPRSRSASAPSSRQPSKSGSADNEEEQQQQQVVPRLKSASLGPQQMQQQRPQLRQLQLLPQHHAVAA